MAEQDLSHFEVLSAITPKKVPYAILIGALLLIPVLYIINWLAPNEGVDDLKKVEDAKSSDTPAMVQPASVGDDDDI